MMSNDSCVHVCADTASVGSRSRRLAPLFPFVISLALSTVAGCGSASDDGGRGPGNTNTDTNSSGAVVALNREVVEPQWDNTVTSNANYRSLSAADARQLLMADGFTFQTLEPAGDKAVLIDVGTLPDSEEWLIMQSYKVNGYQGVENAVLEISFLSDKTTTIVLYSRYGEMSKLTAHALLNAGYQTVYDLGSISHWPADETWQ